DHAEMVELLEMLLARRGFMVTVACSMNAALNAAEAREVDVLVTDLRLPDGDGCELLARLRASGHLPAIALSGFDRDADVSRSRAAPSPCGWPGPPARGPSRGGSRGGGGAVKSGSRSRMAREVSAKDWSCTSVGPPERWCRSLNTALRIMLTSRYAMWMGWGE